VSDLTLGEQKAMAAHACEVDPESVAGFVTIVIRGDGTPAIASSATTSAVIIETLAGVIETLASALADGVDMQAEAAARGE
jgi:hypothetical protein